MNAKRTYTLSEAGELEDRTDWQALRDLTDAEIEAAMRDDPDWADLLDVDWSKAKVVYPASGTSPEVPASASRVTVELDPEMEAFLGGRTADPQARIRCILRHYMQHAQRKRVG